MRGWIKIDDAMPEHPKIAALAPSVAWTFFCSIAYSSRNLTDGFVPEQIAIRLGGDHGEAIADALIEHGLWDEVEGGFQIHDYLDYQRSRADVLALKEARIAAGRLGGKRSSRAKDKQVLKQNVSKGQAEQEQEQEKVKTTARKPRAPDPLWDTLVSLIGQAPAGMERGRWNAALKSLREAEATPDQLRAAAAAYRRLPTFHDCVMTPTAIAANWTVLITNSNGPSAPSLSPYEAARAWVLSAGWRYDDADLIEELGRRGFEGEQRRRLAELALERQAQVTA